jgi:hypothetical protein
MVVNYQIRERERLAKEADEVSRQEGIVRDIERRAAKRHVGGEESTPSGILRQ